MEELWLKKSTLRLRARAARRAITHEMRERAAEAIAERVLALPEIERAEAVLLYGASPEEAEPLPLEEALRARGVRVAYPRVAGRHHLDLHWVDERGQLVEGSFGLLEPSAEAACALPAEIDAIVVPGVAFDERGGRLGYGRGYYDELLSAECAGVPTIGIAYDEQVVAEVPCEERDVRMSVLVTPTRTIRCATSRP
jgi:5-formyltetrahydrofolate cyclo-ligase